MSVAQSAILRTALVWGTTVIAVRDLRRGESLCLGDRPGAVFAKPEGMLIADWPFRAVAGGFEVDVRGATGGLLRVQGRTEDPARLAQAAAPIALGPGDHGVVQYGSFALFFQLLQGAPSLRRRRIDWRAVFAFVFALVTIGGAVFFLAKFAPRAIDKPPELTNPREIAVRYRVHVMPAGAKHAPDVTDHTPTAAAVTASGDDLDRILKSIPSDPERIPAGAPVAAPSGAAKSGDDGKPSKDAPEKANPIEHPVTDIDKVVAAKKEAFSACYAVGRADNPRLAGEVDITWNITAAGMVEGARIATSTISNPRVEACVLNQIQKLRFRRANAAQNTSFSFTFPFKE